MDKFPYITTLLLAQIKRLDVVSVLDVGAFEGGSSIMLAKHNPRISVHAIEPHPESCSVLRRNSRKLTNYFIHEMALGEKVGPTVLVSGKGKQGATLYPENSGREFPVHCDTLAAFCQEKGAFDMVILNCEGGEFAIFDDDKSRRLLFSAKVIDLSLHGKSFKYLSEAYAKKKLRINQELVREGFILAYGDMLTKLDGQPRGHIRQVWIRE